MKKQLARNGKFDGQPLWDAQRRQLWLGSKLVKEFHQQAANQILILDVFQEEDWPARIDDPLPPVDGVDSKRRLHDAIKNLNKCRKHLRLRFHGDGTGTGVLWEA